MLARIVAQLQTDWLWFHELGQENVFWTMVANRWLAGGLAGLGTTMFLLANLWFVERIAPDERTAAPRTHARSTRGALGRRRVLSRAGMSCSSTGRRSSCGSTAATSA